MKLTDADWRRVFTLRCRAKQGQGLTIEESALIDRAWRQDRPRYAALDDDIFEATAPFGSVRTTRSKA